MEKKKNPNHIMLFAGAAVLIIVYMVYISYYGNIMEEAGVRDEPGENYRMQFEMIVDAPNSKFWQAVYDSADERARENEVLLELKGTGWESKYDKNDFMNMSIAAKVDGIILEYNGEPGLEEKINEAVESGIPVVTVMSDAPHSKRQSFVGISDYQLGEAYAGQVAKYMDKDTRRILILMKRNLDDMNQSKIYTQISNAAKDNIGGSGQIAVTGRNLLTSGAFEAEEVIRDFFQRAVGPPDILVCMDEETTECARQAVIDFNLAKRVKIIGYYTSENIMDAINKGLICATCRVDTGQLGQNSVQALVDYRDEGRVSSYYNVDVDFITGDGTGATERRQDADEKDALEEPLAGQ